MMKQLRNQSGMVDMILITVVLVGAIVVGGYVIYQQAQTKKAQNDAANGVLVAKHTKVKPAVALTGTMSGNASYPASGLAPDEQICAQPTTGSAAPICTTVGGQAGLSYTLSVPAGTYYVYATAVKELYAYKAYYDQYSVCGNQASCPVAGHKQYVAVKVESGKTVAGVDPGDWYDDAQAK